jgi:hypothetical protein
MENASWLKPASCNSVVCQLYIKTRPGSENFLAQIFGRDVKSKIRDFALICHHVPNQILGAKMISPETTDGYIEWHVRGVEGPC